MRFVFPSRTRVAVRRQPVKFVAVAHTKGCSQRNMNWKQSVYICTLIVLLCGVASLLAVPLDRTEYDALMGVYDNSVPGPLSTSRYPRFGVDDECISTRGFVGDRLSCSDGKVVFL